MTDKSDLINSATTACAPQVPPPDRADYERRSQSPLWQVRAQALMEIRDNHLYRYWTYRDTEKYAARTYPSLGTFAEDLPQPIPYKTSYGTAKLAEAPHFQRYELLRTAPINLAFAKRLYELPLDHPIIELLLLYLHLGGQEEEAIRALKDEEDPIRTTRELLGERLAQIPNLLTRANSLLSSGEGTVGPAEFV